MRKNRTKRTRVARSHARALGKTPGLTLIKRTISELGVSIARLAQDAKEWWWEKHGKSIKNGHVKEVIHAFRRNTLKPPKWLTAYIERALAA